MNSTEIFSIALGQERPWQIRDVRFETPKESERELHIYLDFERGAKFPSRTGEVTAPARCPTAKLLPFYCFSISEDSKISNVDDRDPKILKTLTKNLFGKLFGDKGYISKSLFEMLFNSGVHIVTGIKSNMKNRPMSFHDRILLRKRSVIETINDELKKYLFQ
jgi:hypothetical protein